jgi:hypothetical protein
MDQIISTVPFEVGDIFVDEKDVPRTPAIKPKAKLPERSVKQTDNAFESVIKELDDLIGLESIKKKVKEYTTYLNFIKLRKEKGFEDADKINLHAVFHG